MQEELVIPTTTPAPKAAAVASIVFSILLILSFVLLLRSIPANAQNDGAWLFTQGRTVLLALNLVPFAGIAFLWFMGVVRDLLGAHEDRFLASSFYSFGHLITSEIINTYMLKMAGVFMMSTSTLFLRARVIPKWIAYLGYGLAAIMLLRISHLDRLGWVSLSFPFWVLLVSFSILMSNYHKQTRRLVT